MIDDGLNVSKTPVFGPSGGLCAGWPPRAERYLGPTARAGGLIFKPSVAALYSGIIAERNLIQSAQLPALV